MAVPEFPGLENLDPTFAYHLGVNLPAASSQFENSGEEKKFWEIIEFCSPEAPD